MLIKRFVAKLLAMLQKSNFSGILGILPIIFHSKPQKYSVIDKKTQQF